MKENDIMLTMGQLVDMPLEDFENALIEQEVNLGVIKGLILNFESVYFELRTRKDAIIKLVTSGDKSKEEVSEVLNGLYAELIKTEQKITYLKQRAKELDDLTIFQ